MRIVRTIADRPHLKVSQGRITSLRGKEILYRLAADETDDLRELSFLKVYIRIPRKPAGATTYDLAWAHSIERR